MDKEMLDTTMQVRTSQAEKERFQRLAKRQGRSLSDYLRIRLGLKNTTPSTDTKTKLVKLWPKAIGYENWPKPGRLCERCQVGFIEQLAGMRTCGYCGKSHFSTKAVCFDELELGEKFYSASDHANELRVWVKVKAEWTQDNALKEEDPHYIGGFGPQAAVIRIEDCEV